jgi:hypothetical protein
MPSKRRSRKNSNSKPKRSKPKTAKKKGWIEPAPYGRLWVNQKEYIKDSDQRPKKKATIKGIKSLRAAINRLKTENLALKSRKPKKRKCHCSNKKATSKKVCKTKTVRTCKPTRKAKKRSFKSLIPSFLK